MEKQETEIHVLCERALEYVKRTIYCERTSMLLDYKYHGDSAQWPTPGECFAGYPNPSGYGTGMEDCCLAGGTMLDACVELWEKTGNQEAADFAAVICEGLLRCAESAKSPGYIPRGLSPFDGVSHYPDSSRDQYTLFAYGLHRYYNSMLCSKLHRERIANAARRIAERAERNVTQETGYDLLNENGGKTFNSLMWEDRYTQCLGNHEVMRLPCLYLFAYETTGDVHFLQLYRYLRESGLDRCLPMSENGYWALYTLHQMQCSLRLCYDADPDREWKEKIRSVMNEAADYSDDIAAKNCAERIKADPHVYNMHQLPFRKREMEKQKAYAAAGAAFALSPITPDMMDYFNLQNMADIVIVPGLVPGRTIKKNIVDLFLASFNKIDFENHERNLPVYFCCGGTKII